MTIDNSKSSPEDGGYKIILRLDRRGLTVYANDNGLSALISELARIKDSPPEENCECHVRLNLDPPYPTGRPGTVRLDIDPMFGDIFSEIPDSNTPPGAFALGFELTFMHVSDHQQSNYVSTADTKDDEDDV